MKVPRVNVLVDLPRGPNAGGHMRFWERIAQAAARAPAPVDLTVHVSGTHEELASLAPHVRFAAHPPVFSTRKIPFLTEVPDHTDLAPFHRRVARSLSRADVLHTTDAYFAFARTALRIARERGTPLVSSIHTATPAYTKLYMARTLERLIGRSLTRAADARLRLTARAEESMLRRLDEHRRHCAFVLVPPSTQGAAAGERVLRRGLDHEHFHPAKRDRARLHAELGIKGDPLVVLFVGRVDAGKNAGVLVDAVETLLHRGRAIHLLCAGEGSLRSVVQERLGHYASCPGVLDPDRLARAYASADVFAQPSRIEECSNVVLEALASGVPVLSAEHGGGAAFVDGESGLVVRGEGPEPWVRALAALADDAARRAALGAAARQQAERTIPSWREVFEKDLVPTWLEAAERGARRT